MVMLDQIVSWFAARGVTLHPWQCDGLRWMLQCEAEGLAAAGGGGGGILADEPGLGKTYTSLGVVAGDVIRGRDTHTLVVVPTSVLYQWVEASTVLFGSEHVATYYGKSRSLGNHQVVVTTYGILGRDDSLLEYNWDRVILDEIHYLKNYRSRTSIRARRLVGGQRWGLTGTPFQNSSEELASLFRFVCGIRSQSKFVTVNQLLPELVRDRLLRRTKAELPDGPGISGLVLETTEVDFRTERERDIYETVSRNVDREFKELLASDRPYALEAFELLLRLRQCSQHPELGLRGLGKKYQIANRHRFTFAEVSSKMLAVAELLGEHPTEPGLVFSPFRQELELLESYLTGLDYQVYRFDGSLSGGARGTLLARMRANLGKVPTVMLIQSRAGGVGLNLQEFSRVYLMTPDWNPSNDLQAIARAHRLGQTKTVWVKTLVIRDPHSIDHRILQIQRKKGDLMESLLGERFGLDGSRRARFTAETWGQLLAR